MMTIMPLVKEMARENTESHFLDSGLIYGYQYERPIPEHPITISIDEYIEEDGEVSYSIDATISTIHFLSSVLDDEIPDLDKQFQAFLDADTQGTFWLALMEDFVDSLQPDDVIADNTYNYDTHLDQDFQFIMFAYDSEWYVALSTHNGCDIRGGYSRPHIFRVIDEAYFFDWKIDFYCPACQVDAENDSDIVIRKTDSGYTIHHAECGEQIVFWSAAEGF